jgi:hypothetical protein
MTNDGPRKVGAFNPAIKDNGFLAIFSKESNGDSGHTSLLTSHRHTTDIQEEGQVTLVILKEAVNGMLPAGYQRNVPPGNSFRAL